jgi:hypothetical protein
MPATTPRFELAARVTELFNQRKAHQDAIDEIDGTIAKIEQALGVSLNGRGRPKRAPLGRQGKRARGKFSTTAEDTILTFVRGHKNPTTAEINKHWKSEGRKGTADNALTKMVKEKKLKRAKVPEGRGSTYSVA